MYSASAAARSAVTDQHIRDNAVTRHQRLFGRSRASAAELDHVWQGLEQSLIDDAVDQWQHACVLMFVSVVDILNIPVNLFSLYLMNFVSHHVWCSGNILRLHYKSMKCDISFSQGSVSTLLRWGKHVSRVCVKVFFLLTAVQQEGQHPLTGQRVANFRRDLGAT